MRSRMRKTLSIPARGQRRPLWPPLEGGGETCSPCRLRQGAPALLLVVVVASVVDAAIGPAALFAFAALTLVARAATVLERTLPALLVSRRLTMGGTTWTAAAERRREGGREATASSATAGGALGPFPFGMGQVDDQPPTPEVSLAKRIGGGFRCFRAGHGDEAEASLTAVGVHRQVHADNAVGRRGVDEDLNLFLGGVVREVSDVEGASGGLLRPPGSPRPRRANAAGTAGGVPLRRFGLEGANGDRLARLHRSVERIASRLSFLRRCQGHE